MYLLRGADICGRGVIRRNCKLESTGKTLYLLACMNHSCFSCSSLAGYLAATSSASEKSSLRLNSIQGALSMYSAVVGSPEGQFGAPTWARQPSSWMDREPSISKYWASRGKRALGLSNVDAKLIPSIGAWATPLMDDGIFSLRTSRVVGTRS